jgi:hypothetical protein
MGGNEAQFVQNRNAYQISVGKSKRQTEPAAIDIRIHLYKGCVINYSGTGYGRVVAFFFVKIIINIWVV